MSDFRLQVLAVVRRIPRGHVATYGDVAAATGRPRAHRAVGNIMRAVAIPRCRVIGWSVPAARWEGTADTGH